MVFWFEAIIVNYKVWTLNKKTLIIISITYLVQIILLEATPQGMGGAAVDEITFPPFHQNSYIVRYRVCVRLFTTKSDPYRGRVRSI